LAKAMYSYYYFSTDSISNTWDTKKIEMYLLNREDFANDGLGSFMHNSIFLSIQLLLVKDYNSWSSNDYNDNGTNYISIVTSYVVEPVVEQFFQDFEKFIGRHVVKEEE